MTMTEPKSEPKSGDRVRITFEATWASGPTGETRPFSAGFIQPPDVPDGARWLVPKNATIEVRPEPVYENDDATEYRLGDYVLDARGVSYLRVQDRLFVWYSHVAKDTFTEDAPQRPLTLLATRSGPCLR
jgi:hypothetical protein